MPSSEDIVAFPTMVAEHYTSLTRLTDATDEPVTFDEVRTALRLPSSTSQSRKTDIEGLITAVRLVLENEYSFVTISQSWELVYDGVPASLVLELPMSPLLAADFSITSYAKDNSSTVFDSTKYVLDTNPRPPDRGRVFLNDGVIWPTDLRRFRALVFAFKAGYGTDADAVPMVIKKAIMRMVVTQWENPQDIVVSERSGGEAIQIPDDVRRLLATYRRIRL